MDFLSVLVCLACALQTDEAPQLLVFTRFDIAQQRMIAWGEEQGYEVVVARDPDVFEPRVPAAGEWLPGFGGRPWDAVFFRMTAEDEVTLTTRQHQGLFDLVRSGAGFVGVHSATAELEESFRSGSEPATDRWAYGAGRVFYTPRGLLAADWDDAGFKAELLGGLRWAAGLEDPQTAAQEQPVDEGPRLLVPEGFASELVDEAPHLLWPSAVHALPDGSILVGSDPMDMPGPPDAPIDSIWRYVFNEDGSFERTLFAERLYAVFGIEDRDGDVYVMNMPYLTRLRDVDGDGIAEERDELLTDLGPPAPGWPGGFNDHIVSGLRFGHDGWLYVSVGDKGVPGATGTDGSRLVHRGGGVIRLRPDGSRLETYASGTRNHLDVAIDERGEMFTYDNTDDGLGWWTRLTHIVPGGYYGYPWDYGPHPERCLPPMADYGGGSPCGALAYREDAWPAPYSGSLYFCEWGKGVVRRFELAQDGSTFEVTVAEDFARPGEVRDFRPLDLCTTPDGRSMYVTDWGFGSWRKDVERGRLWRIRRVDDAPVAARAPLGEERSIAAWILDLGHPGYTERVRSQRALAAAGEAAIGPLERVLLEKGSGERARRHALWALDELARLAATTAADGPDVARAAHAVVLGALNHASAHTRAQALRVMAEADTPVPATRVAKALLDPSPEVRRAAADIARRGRLTETGRALLAAWRGASGDAFLRFGLRRAMGAVGAYPLVLDALTLEPDPDRRGELMLVFHEAFDVEAVQALANCIADERTSAPLRAEFAPPLAALTFAPEPWDGRWWSIQPASMPRPAKSIEWEGTLPALRGLRAALDDPAPEVRRTIAHLLGQLGDREGLAQLRLRFDREPDDQVRLAMLATFERLEDDGARELLARLVRDHRASAGLRRRAIEVASRIASPAMRRLLANASTDPATPPELLADCLRALARAGGAGDSVSYTLVQEHLGHADAGVRVAAIDAGASLDVVRLKPSLQEALGDPEGRVRAAAARAYARLPRPLETALVDRLVMLASDPEAGADAIRTLSFDPEPRALPALLVGLASSSEVLRERTRQALVRLLPEVRPRLEEMAAARELEPGVLRELRELFKEHRPILDWELAGPFPEENAPDTPDVWQRYVAPLPDGHVDLLKALGNAEVVLAYGRATLVSSVERDAEFMVGSDDSIRVWVNGEEALTFPGERGWGPDQDRFTVLLAAGPNEIRVAVGNRYGGFGFSVKVEGEATGPLFEALGEAPTIGDYRSLALAGGGDAALGAQVFRSLSGPNCIRCHIVRGEGASVGPELSDVGVRLTRAEIVEAILEPSAKIQGDYKMSWFELEGGFHLFGRVISEVDGRVSLVDADGESHELLQGDWTERGTSNLSLMPESVLTMTPQEFHAVVAWLETLRP